MEHIIESYWRCGRIRVWQFVNMIKKEMEEWLEGLAVYPDNALGDVPSGCLSIGVKESQRLKDMQKLLFTRLEECFGPCPAEHDHDYWFHMTIALGGAPYENYKRAYDVISQRSFDQTFVFSRMGLLYYDDDKICPGTYFCYKVSELS